MLGTIGTRSVIDPRCRNENYGLFSYLFDSDGWSPSLISINDAQAYSARRINVGMKQSRSEAACAVK